MKNAVYWVAIAVAVAAMLIGKHLIGYEQTQLWIGVATLPVAFVFIGLYAADGWWRTWFGRSLMLLAVSVMAYALAVVLIRSFGDYAGRGYLLLFATGGTFLAMLIRTIVLWSVKVHERQARKHPETQ